MCTGIVQRGHSSDIFTLSCTPCTVVHWVSSFIVLVDLSRYALAYDYYLNLNHRLFTVPSIVLTALSAFMSFAAATDPARSQVVAPCQQTQVCEKKKASSIQLHTPYV